jgi:hypothetical protein
VSTNANFGWATTAEKISNVDFVPGRVLHAHNSLLHIPSAVWASQGIVHLTYSGMFGKV